MTAATNQPPAQKLSSKTTTLPRLSAETLSETKVEATGSSPPKPAPIKNLKTRKAASDVVSADAPLPTEKSSKVMIKTFFRPIRSAINPKISAPTAIPMELILPIQPISPGVKSHSTFKAAIIKLSIPTSRASNIQPIPAILSNLRVDISFLSFMIIPLCNKYVYYSPKSFNLGKIIVNIRYSTSCHDICHYNPHKKGMHKYQCIPVTLLIK